MSNFYDRKTPQRDNPYTRDPVSTHTPNSSLGIQTPQASNMTPYTPVYAPLQDRTPHGPYGESARAELASRVSRWVAIMIDGACMGVLGVVLAFVLRVLGVDWLRDPREDAFGYTVFAYAMMFLWYSLNWRLLKERGQTFGKKVMGIRIAQLDGSVPPVWRILLLRVLAFSFVSNLPAIGTVIAFLDIALIFSSEKRCLHDHLAGTKVVEYK